jgi:hypothetical protein
MDHMGQSRALALWFEAGHVGIRGAWWQDRPVAESVMAREAGAGLVLLTLATGQSLMTLDTSVMNVSMAQVAQEVGTSLTGIQTAITLYTLVMATMMIAGGKVGSNIGRRRAFATGAGLLLAGGLPERQPAEHQPDADPATEPTAVPDRP